ncbi:MAG: type II toxin-antitoxin system HipA family toxin [Epsilonproteobacteria bacterium]|nr:MAG: type II toxin-antitoxin system HipA family toxin [Campylobacterota bacterium]
MVGTLALVEGKIYFEYSRDFLETGLELSPFKLPLKSGAVCNEDGEFEGLFGLFNDSLPDGWGRLLIDRYLRKNSIVPETITALERLLYVGSNFIGALEYKPNLSADLENNMVKTIDLQTLDNEMQKIIKGDSGDVLEELISLNGSSAGARPKALLQISSDKNQLLYGVDTLQSGFEHWLVKFSNSYDSKYAGNIEYAYSLMAKKAGLEMPETHLFHTKEKRAYFGIKRFDRIGDKHLHVHTLCGLVHSNFRVPSLDYDDLLSVTLMLTKNVTELEKAFRLACFNVLAHNKDDHEKNVSFIMDSIGRWRLAPAYDLTFSHGPNGWQSMSVMGEGNTPGINDLIKLAKAHDIVHYRKIIDDVVSALSQWDTFAEIAGVGKRESLGIKKMILQ